MADADHSAPMKTCTACRKEKPATADHFGPHKMGRGGFNPKCRPCKKADDTERRARPDQKARQKAWRDANKDKVRETTSPIEPLVINPLALSQNGDRRT